jgi:hypothetical protein
MSAKLCITCMNHTPKGTDHFCSAFSRPAQTALCAVTGLVRTRSPAYDADCFELRRIGDLRCGPDGNKYLLKVGHYAMV